MHIYVWELKPLLSTRIEPLGGYEVRRYKICGLLTAEVYWNRTLGIGTVKLDSVFEPQRVFWKSHV